MVGRLAALNRPQRILVFILFFGGGLFLLVGLTALLALNAINSAPRTTAVSLVDGVSVQEFAVLPDDDAYPASLAASPDGTVYTGSYVSGAIWSIDNTGAVTEAPNTRKIIGSVSGMTVGRDGTLYVVDRLTADLGRSGGAILRVAPGGGISEFGSFDDAGGPVVPDDIALDSQGNVYVSDWGRDVVWRFQPGGGVGEVWWASPKTENVNYAPTGLAYDPVRDALIITDPEVNAVYRVPVSAGAAETQAKTEALYLHGDKPDAPGFDGVTVTPDGVIYVAALGLNRVARLQDGELIYIAGSFRGASDVDYADGALYVTNWDQFSLLSRSVLQPRLPFALDVIRLSVGGGS